MNYHIKLMRSSDDEQKFFAKMGKFFASKEVRKELGGYPMNDADNYLWLVALEKRTFFVVGFVSIEERDDGLMMHDGYIVPVHREKGLFAELLSKMLHYAGTQGKTLHASVPKDKVPIFERRGFKKDTHRGSWYTMRLEVKKHG